MSKQRRIFIIQSVLGVAGVMGASFARAEPARLQETEPLAVEHGYKLDATKVDKQKYPQYVTGHICGNCQLFEDQGKGWGGCALFPERLVGVNAWCDAWG